MSLYHQLSVVTPASPPPLDLRSNLNNYLLFRSFQTNFSDLGVVHIPVYRPGFNGSLVAGDHYFDFRVKGIPYPVISITFYISPSIITPLPTITSHQSSRFRGIEVSYFWFTIPGRIPSKLEDLVLEFGQTSGHNLCPFLFLLDDFIEAFNRPVTPPTSPIPSPTIA